MYDKSVFADFVFRNFFNALPYHCPIIVGYTWFLFQGCPDFNLMGIIIVFTITYCVSYQPYEKN